jgi:hypothetical protein
MDQIAEVPTEEELLRMAQERAPGGIHIDELVVPNERDERGKLLGQRQESGLVLFGSDVLLGCVKVHAPTSSNSTAKL